MDQSEPIQHQQQEEPIAAGGGRRARDRFSTVLYLRQLLEHKERKSWSSSPSVGGGGRPDLPKQLSSSLVLPKQPSLQSIPNPTPASSTRSNFNSMSSSFGSGCRSKAKPSSPLLPGSAPVGGSVGGSFNSARSKASAQGSEPGGANNDDSASSFDFDSSIRSSGSIRSSWVEREGARRKQKGPNPFAFF